MPRVSVVAQNCLCSQVRFGHNLNGCSQPVSLKWEPNYYTALFGSDDIPLRVISDWPFIEPMEYWSGKNRIWSGKSQGILLLTEGGHPVTCAPTQISLGILYARRNLGSLATHSAHSEDSDQTGLMPRLIWVFAGCTGHFVGFVV